jgi:hypothetical protein
MQLQKLLETGLLHPTDPLFRPPFHHSNRSFWTGLSLEEFRDTVLLWLQTSIRTLHQRPTHGVSKGSAAHLSPDPGALYEDLRDFLEEATIFHADPLATAVAVFHRLQKGGWGQY